MMNLDQWLRGVYDDEMLTKEASDLEAVFDQMSPEELLGIAMGEKTAGAVTNLVKKHPLAIAEGGIIGTAIGANEYRKFRNRAAGTQPQTKTASSRLQFVDTVARQLAWEHLDVEKQARIFGESRPYHELATGEIPYSQREAAYRQYVKAKAKEDPTSWGAALGGGAMIGGTLGGISGASKAGLPGAAIGIPIGALGGAGVGAIARMADKGEIARVRGLAKDRKAFKRDMSRQVSDEKYRQASRKTFRRERRHQEMVDAIRELKKDRG